MWHPKEFFAAARSAKESATQDVPSTRRPPHVMSHGLTKGPSYMGTEYLSDLSAKFLVELGTYWKEHILGDHAGQIIKEHGNNMSRVLDIEKSEGQQKLRSTNKTYPVSSTFYSIWPHYTTSTYNQVVYILLSNVPSSPKRGKSTTWRCISCWTREDSGVYIYIYIHMCVDVYLATYIMTYQLCISVHVPVYITVTTGWLSSPLCYQVATLVAPNFQEVDSVSRFFPQGWAPLIKYHTWFVNWISEASAIIIVHINEKMYLSLKLLSGFLKHKKDCEGMFRNSLRNTYAYGLQDLFWFRLPRH